MNTLLRLLGLIFRPLRPLLIVAPTERAAWLVAGLAPIALVIAATAPGAWVIAPIAGAVLLALIAADALLSGRNTDWDIHAPADVEVGQPAMLAVTARFAGGRQRNIAAALACDSRLASGGRRAGERAGRHHPQTSQTGQGRQARRRATWQGSS